MEKIDQTGTASVAASSDPEAEKKSIIAEITKQSADETAFLKGKGASFSMVEKVNKMKQLINQRK